MTETEPPAGRDDPPSPGVRGRDLGTEEDTTPWSPGSGPAPRDPGAGSVPEAPGAASVPENLRHPTRTGLTTKEWSS